MSNNDKPTREVSTQQEYLKRTMNFIKRAFNEAKEQNHDILKNPNNITIHSFGSGGDIEGLTLYNTCIWACKHWATNITQESWRSYRSALIFTAEIYYSSQEIDENTFSRIKRALDVTKGLSKKDVELRTSAKKQKHLAIKDLKKIDKELSKSKSIWAAPTRLWLRAGIIVGLRPTEWRKTELFEEDKKFLRVKNAKNSNNRANGEFRTLYLDHLTDDEYLIIKNHLKIVNSFKDSKDGWIGYYRGCSNLLKTKNKKVFPNRKKHPTLYSARHQFSANAKASGCKPEEIAALMGHASDLTAQMTYGKKVNGTRGRKPEFEDREVKSVRVHKKTEKYFSFKNDKFKNGVKNK